MHITVCMSLSLVHGHCQCCMHRATHPYVTELGLILFNKSFYGDLDYVH